MKTSVNQQFAGLYSAVARLCAGLVSSAARHRVAGLALAVMKTTAIRNRCLKLGLGLFLIVATAIAAQAQYTYTELQITGNPTTPKGIAGNRIVGAYQTVGFIYDGTGYVTPDKPFGATSFHFSGLSGNTAVGTYTTAGLSHGFTYDLVSSTFTPQPKPSGDSFMEYVNGISGNLIVGYYIDNLGGQHGFLYDGTNYTGMSHPQGVNGTLPYGISDGNIVGDYTDASWKNHGFLCNIATGVYTTLDHPSGTSGTFPRGISGNLMVGNYKDSSWVYHGFVYNLSTGTFTTVDHASNDNDNRINGISSGVLVGFYQDSSSVSHGFVAVPAAAASTTTTLAANLNPSTVGASVTFTATVSPSAATGTVTFKDGATTLGTGTLSGGTATYTTAALTVGTHSITAEYGGDSGYLGSTNSPALAQTVNPVVPPTATTLAATTILSTAATLNSRINPGGYADAFFQYGTSTNTGPVVSTLVGSTYGYVDGSAAVALMKRPQLLAVDAGGNIYFADQDVSAIRKVAPDGSVSTLAGSATSGFVNGSGSAASFSTPWGVAVDAAGTVYVADTYNKSIRKITAGGAVTTLAGNGTAGFADGTGTAARFNYPIGIAVGPDGNIYVADRDNNRIRKVTPAGVVTTLAGGATAGFADGTGPGASFNQPFGLAVDGATNVYVADAINNRIRKVTPGGVVTTLAGSGSAGFADGQGTAAQFNYPYGVAVDTSGNLLVGDSANHRIRKITPGGGVTTFAGSSIAGYRDGPALQARFDRPNGVALDAAGNLYVADQNNYRIRKIAAPPALVLALAQSGLTGTNPVPASLSVTGLLPGTTYYFQSVATNTAGTASGSFLSFTTPSTNASLAALALSDGTLAPAFASNTVSYAASVPNATTSITVTPTVAQANMTVTVNGTSATSGTASGPVSLVVGLNTITVAVTAQDGVTTNGYTVAVTRLPEVPTATTLAATSILGTAATLHSSINPGGWADAYFAYGTSTNPGVVASTFAGSTRGFSNAVGTAAQFNLPARIAVDASGNIYVGDASNHRIRIVTPAGVVTTLAGSGTGGFADGPAATAQFYNPEGVAVAANGNVYVADKNNHRIRIVTPAGVVTTLAGSSTSGFADGTGAGARFNYPSGVAVDSSTNVYVADASNNRIRKVTPGGVVTTLAGDGAGAFADGTGAAARFSGPAGVAVDASGNIYVADQWNNSIRQVTPAGVVTTLAGTNSSGFADGTGAAARFNWPVGVAVDASGNVCVADYLNHRIRMVSAAGVVTTLAGSGTSGFADGPAATAKFKTPAGVAVGASGIVYVGDSGNDRIRKLAQGSLLLLLAQSGLSGTNPVPASLSVTGLLPETTYYFQSVATNLAGTAYGDFLSFTTLSTNASLSGLAFSDGTLAPAFAANTLSYTVSVSNATASITVTPTVAQTNATVTVDGTSVTSGTASGPVSLAVGPNTITVVVTAQDGVTTNSYTVVVTRLAQAPDVTTLAATGIASNAVVLNATFNPHDSTTTAFFQYGTSTNTGLVVTSLAGSRGGGFADGTGAAARFEAPNGVALDADGNTYVADTSNHRIRKVTPAGVVTTLAGTNTFGVADGTGAAAQFDSPQGVAVGPDGNIYVADTGNNRIRKVTPAGVVTTVAGTGTDGFVDGPGATAQFSWPYGVAVDANTNIYVADYNNNRIRKVTPDGTVTTLAGSSMGYLDGTGTGARFGLPAGVAVDASGNVYVADLGNQRIRKVTPAGVVTTLAGSGTSGFADGPAASAQFQWPAGVAVDGAGNTYVADNSNNRIRKITPNGDVTTLAGSGTAGWANGPVATAQFNSPKGVAVDASGAVYVGDTGNSLIRKIAMSTLPVVLAQSDIGGASPTPVSLSVSNLVPETVYYFRGVGTNVAGTSYGDFLSFRTLAINRAPVLVTPITNQPAMFNLAFSLTFPEGTFVDPDGNALSYTATGLPPGILFDGPTRTFAGTPTAAGSYSVALVASDGQVPPLSATNSFAINVAKAPASVALSALSQTYAGTNLAITTATTPSNLTVVVTYNGTTNRPIPAASYTVIGTVDDPNYAGSATNTLVVSPAALSVTANPQTRQYGAPNPPLTVSYNGFVNSETPAVLTTLPGCTTPATSASLVGPYIITPSGGVASNYTLSYFTGTLTVTKAPLLVVGDLDARPYGHTNPVFTAVITGVTNNDNITVAFSTTATNTSSPGDYRIALIMVDPAGKLGQYDLRLRSAYLTVTAAPLTGTAASASRNYGGPNPVFSVTYSGLQNGETTNVLSGPLAYACADTNGVPVNTNTPVGTYAIRVTSGQTATNYTVTYVDGTLTITPAELTVTADSTNRVYGATNPALTGTVTGAVNGDNLTASFATVATLTTPVGGYDIVPVWADPDGKLGNYTSTTNLGTLTITTASLTVDVASHSRAYGASNPPLTGTVTGVLNADNLSVGYYTAATPASPVGGYPIVPTFGDPDGRLVNYSATTNAGTLTVTNAILLGTVDAKTRGYGAANPPFTVTYTGFQSGDTTNVLSGPLAFSCVDSNTSLPVTTNTPVGGYAVSVMTSQTAANYDVQYLSGTLTVTQAVLTVTANNTNRLYGAENPAFTASYSGWQNGEGTEVLGGSLSLNCLATANSPVGNYTITPSGLSAANYSLTYVNGSLAVDKATLLVAADDQSRLYGQTNPVFTATYTGFLNGDSASALSGEPVLASLAESNSPVGQYPITAALGTLATTNYTFAFTNGTLSVTLQELLVRADDASRGYGAQNPAFGVAYLGFVNGETEAVLGGSLSVTSSAATNSSVGAYAIVPAGLTSTNYALTFTNGTLTVTQAVLTVTASHTNRLYGAENPAFTASYSGWQNGESSAVLGSALTLTCAADANSPVGAYGITPAGLTALNYSFNYGNGVLTVDPATLLVAADNQTRLYGRTNPEFTASYSGFVNGDSTNVLSGTPALATPAETNSPVGQYDLTVAQGTLSATNYTFAFTNGTLTVTAQELGVTAADASRAYGATNPVFTVSYTGFVNGDTAAVLGGSLSVTSSATTNSPVGTDAIVPAGLTSTNYALSYTNGTLTVTPAELTVTVDDLRRGYGQTNPPLTGTLAGVVNDDNVTASYTTPATILSSAGNYLISPAWADPASKLGNYEVTTNLGLLTVTQAVLTVTADDQTRPYGQPNPPLTLTYSGFVNGDTVASLTTAPTGTTAATGGSLLGGFPIVPAGGVAANYTFVYVNGTLTVTKAPLLVLGDDAARPYGQTNPVFTATLTGLLADDNISPVFFCPATTNSPLGRYDIDIWLDDPDGKLGYYDVFMLGGQLTVTNASLTGTVASQTRDYGQTNAPFTVTYTGFVNPADTNLLAGPLALVCTNLAGTAVTASSPVGAYPIRVSTGQTLTNYTVQYVAGTLTVTQAVLTVTAADQSRLYGAANPPLTGTLTGVVNGDNLTATYSTTATTTSGVGSYPISPVWSDPGTVLGNYAVTTNQGALVISPALLTVTADPQSRTYGATNPPQTFSYSGFVNGEDATALASVPVAATLATEVSPVGAYAITLSGGSAANYTLSRNDSVLTVTPAALNITADSFTRSFGLTNPLFTGVVTGACNDDVIAVNYTCAAGTNSPVGTYPIEPSLEEPLGVATNYSVTLHNGVLTITSDDPPVIILTNAPWLYTVGLDPLLLEMFGLEDKLIDDTARVSDGGSANFEGGTLTVTLTENGNPADTLSVLAEGDAAEQIGLSGDVVSYGGLPLGTVSGGAIGTALSFSFTSNATPATVQALIRRLAFASTDESTNSRIVSLVLTDGDGGVSAPATRLLGINRSPWTTGDDLTVREGVNTSLSFAWLLSNDTDADGDPLTLTDSSVVSAHGGRIVKTGTNLVYRSAPGFVGQDVFAYVVMDGRGGESVGLVWITVLRQNTLRLVPASVQSGSPATRIQMAGLPGRSYRIETSADLANWSVLSTAVASPDGIVEVLDTAAKDHPQRFYRAIVQ